MHAHINTQTHAHARIKTQTSKTTADLNQYSCGCRPSFFWYFHFLPIAKKDRTWSFTADIAKENPHEHKYIMSINLLLKLVSGEGGAQWPPTVFSGLCLKVRTAPLTFNILAKCTVGSSICVKRMGRLTLMDLSVLLCRRTVARAIKLSVLCRHKDHTKHCINIVSHADQSNQYTRELTSTHW